jgi:hypothetical protein
MNATERIPMPSAASPKGPTVPPGPSQASNPQPRAPAAPPTTPPRASASSGARSPSAQAKIDAQAAIDARTIEELMVPGALAAILGDKLVGPCGVKVAFEHFLKHAGSPTDPVERCLLEQLFLAHHRLARLQVQAAEATTLEGAKVRNAAAVRLLGEIRRLALTIRQYRAPLASRSFSVIHQQNVATSGGQQDVTMVEQPSGKETLISRDRPPAPAMADDLQALRERAVRGGPGVGAAPPARATAKV